MMHCCNCVHNNNTETKRLINYFECQNGPQHKPQCCRTSGQSQSSPSSSCEPDQSPFCGREIDDWSYRSINDGYDENYSNSDFVQLVIALCCVFKDAFRKSITLLMTFATAAIIVYRMTRQIYGMVLGIRGKFRGSHNRSNRQSMAVFLMKCIAIAVSLYVLVTIYGPVITCHLSTIMKLKKAVSFLFVHE